MMGKSFHNKREYEKRVREMGISAAKAPACVACAATSNTLLVRRRKRNCGRPYNLNQNLNYYEV